MRILLLSAYDAKSHQYWRKGLVAAFPEHHWHVLTLPPRHFSWRVRGNSLSWGLAQRETLSQQYDLVMTTSLTDLSALRGFIPSLGRIRTLVYFHENQFAYPRSSLSQDWLHPALTSIYTALCGDQLLFNSDFNRQTFLTGTDKLLKKMPDHVPKNIAQMLSERSEVLPVPLQDTQFLASLQQPGPLEVIWNHRWEFDKNPDLLLAVMQQLTDSPVRFHIVGQQFRHWPKALQTIEALHQHQLGHFGYVDSVSGYLRLLQQADAVLSTAAHDFQGLSVQEAVAAGCIPVLPEHQAYPEFFPNHCVENSAKALADRIKQLAKAKSEGHLPAAPSVHALSWSKLRYQYATRLAE